MVCAPSVRPGRVAPLDCQAPPSRRQVPFDDRLEDLPGEVKPAEQCVPPVDPRQPHRMPRDVHRTGVTATGVGGVSASTTVWDGGAGAGGGGAGGSTARGGAAAAFFISSR